MSLLVLNSLAFGLSVGLILAYHLYLRYQLSHNPSYTIQGVINQAREVWVETNMATPDRDILAVQTLRNSTMAATFLASTGILLTIGVLNLMEKDDSLGNLFSIEHLTGANFLSNLWLVKLLLLVIVFFWAFFCFSLAIRMFNHLGYLINACDKDEFCPRHEYVALLLNRAGAYYSWGMRAYYLSVPLVFWLFGPLYLLVASVGLVIALYYIDRAPAEIQTESSDTGNQSKED